MAKIVISYRRNDTKWITGRIFENLERHFGDGNVFMDIDNIPVGLDYRDHIRSVLENCDVLGAVGGPNWQKASGAGETTLDDETDWVRLEISTALARKVPVVPLLIDGTKMPKANLLPEDLRAFAFRQAANFDTEDFRNQMRRLTNKLDEVISLADKAKFQSTAVRLVKPLAASGASDTPSDVAAPAKLPEQRLDKSAAEQKPVEHNGATTENTSLAEVPASQSSQDIISKHQDKKDQLPASAALFVSEQLTSPNVSVKEVRHFFDRTWKFGGVQFGLVHIWSIGLVLLLFAPLTVPYDYSRTDNTAFMVLGESGLVWLCAG